MLKSMTAFGRCKTITPSGTKNVSVEIRSVNNRYFDCTVKLPRQFSFLEDKIRAYLSERGISRGKIDVSVGVETIRQEDMKIVIDTGIAEMYINALRELRDAYGLRDDISVMSVARNPDVFRMVSTDEDEENSQWNDILPVLSEAVDRFIEARIREGEALEKDMAVKVGNIRSLAAEINSISLGNIKDYPDKFRKRMERILDDFNAQADENILLNEVALFADRISIDEEVVRLNTHLDSFMNIIASEEVPGRKLDFLVQEINREANTMASKSQDMEISRKVVEIKAEIEKIREQIQNIE